MFSYFTSTVEDSSIPTTDATGGRPILTITGVTGFIGSQMLNHCLKEYASKFRIRGMVRNQENVIKLGPLREFFSPEQMAQVEFVSADLNDEEEIDKAIQGSTYVIHTASPVAVQDPCDEEELVTPAVNGAVNIMKACQKHKVKRIVMTSSHTAVCGQEEPEPELLDETMWSNVDGQVKGFDAYGKSKTLSEKAAWDFLNEIPDGDYKPELATILPGFVVGEYITGGIASSPALIKALMMNTLPGIPRLSFPCVDIHDVVKAHFNALFKTAANGQRFLVVSESLYLIDMCNILREGLAADYDYEIAEAEMNRCPIYLISWFSTDAKSALDKWDHEQTYDTSKAKNVLKVEYKDVRVSIMDTAMTLMETGAVEEKLLDKSVPDPDAFVVPKIN